MYARLDAFVAFPRSFAQWDAIAALPPFPADVHGAVRVADATQVLDDPLDGVEVDPLQELGELPQVVGCDQLRLEGSAAFHDSTASLLPPRVGRI